MPPASIVFELFHSADRYSAEFTLGKIGSRYSAPSAVPGKDSGEEPPRRGETPTLHGTNEPVVSGASQSL